MFPFPSKNAELSNQLAESTMLLRQPVTNRVTHHHYIPKMIWIATGLFVAVVLTCSGYYMTASKLDECEASDTKYRYLKLYNSVFLSNYFLPRIAFTVLIRFFGRGCLCKLSCGRFLTFFYGGQLPDT